MNQPPRKPGLKSVYDLREQRVKGKFTRLTPRILLMLISSFVTIIVGYGFFAKRSLDKSRNELLAKRRAVETTLGPEWFPLRDRIEKLTVETARDWNGDWMDSATGRTDFRTAQTLYLRLRVAEGKDITKLRDSLSASTKDGFIACLMKGTAAPLPDGGAYQITRENVAEVSSLGLREVWNVRQAYASTRVLTDAWADEVKEAGDDLRLRVFEQQFETASKKEIPLAIDIVKRAQYFVLVLDEDAPEALDKTDGGPITLSALELVPHEARVRIWNLKTGAELARLKRAGGATYRFIGEQATQDPEARDALQRQVNNCSLANRVKEALSLR